MSEPAPPPGGPAISVEATQRSLRRYLRVARLAAFMAVALILFAGVVLASHVLSLDLQDDGQQATGLVTSVSTHQVGNPRNQVTLLGVDYTADGNRLHQVISLSRYVVTIHTGQKVTVRYDPEHATSVEVQGYRVQGGVPPFFPLLLGFIVLGFSWPGIRRARFLHQVLSNDPWDAHRAALVEVQRAGPLSQLGGRARILIRLHGMTGTVLAAPVGLRRLNPTFTPVAWVAAFGDQQMVVAPPGGTPIVCVRSVQSTLTR